MDTPAVRLALDNFIADTLRTYPRLEAVFDPGWRSPAELEAPFTGEDGTEHILWQPTARHPDSAAADFAPLERALETTVHPDVKAYYGAYWAAGLEAEAVDGHVSLLFLWNHQDAERLNENLIGHALAQRRARAPFSIFFACTEPDSELFLTVDNKTGAVMLEKPGYRPMRRVARSLAEFIDTLVPRPPELHP